MRSNQILKVGVEATGGFSILASPSEPHRHFPELSILGSSFPARGSENVIFGYLPERHEKGLIVIHARIQLKTALGKHGGWTYKNWFVPVERDEKRTFVHLDTIWAAPSGVLPSVVCYQHGKRYLEVQVGEEYFTSAADGVGGGKGVVASGDVLCQFLVGDISLDELRTAATEAVRQQNLDEKYQALLAQHRELQMKLEENRGVVLQLEYMQTLLKTESDNAANFTNDLRMANECLSRIRELTGTWWSALWNLGTIRASVRLDQESTQ